MNPLDALFRRLRADGRKAFLPFLPAGDPDLATTAALLPAVAAAGASAFASGLASLLVSPPSAFGFLASFFLASSFCR